MAKTIIVTRNTGSKGKKSCQTEAVWSSVGIGIGIVLLEAQQADLPYYRESRVQEVTRMKKERKQNRKD